MKTAPENTLEITVTRLGKAWQWPPQPVEVAERGLGDGWSFYSLPTGKTACVMETIHADWSLPFTHAVLARIVANLTQTCPACGARAVLGTVVEPGAPMRGTMTHEDACPCSDPALADLKRQGGEPHDATPEPPRSWIVWVPRLRPGYRPRRRFDS